MANSGTTTPGRSSKEEKAKEKKEQEWEEREVHEKSAASATIVYKAILKEAEEELIRPSLALAWSGLAAGLSMGFSLVLEGLLQSRLPNAPWRDLVSKLGYTVGFVILILSRQQLFTENTLTPILSLLKKKDIQTLKNVARLWGILLLTNLIGATMIAYTLQRGNAFSEEEKAVFLKISSEAMQPPVATLFIKAIFAGWLIALMVWMLPVAETGRIWVLIIIPYIVGLGGLSHIIIGSIYSIYTIAAHQHTWWEYVHHFALPVLLGNCIGGVTLVAVVNYGQATAGAAEESTS
jgi:formate/nitrite transporter FocA (FNT family)